MDTKYTTLSLDRPARILIADDYSVGPIDYSSIKE